MQHEVAIEIRPYKKEIPFTAGMCNCMKHGYRAKFSFCTIPIIAMKAATGTCLTIDTLQTQDLKWVFGKLMNMTIRKVLSIRSQFPASRLPQKIWKDLLMNLIGKVTIVKNIRKVINYRHTKALWLRQKAFCMKFFHHNKQKTEVNVGTTEMSIYTILRKEMEQITWQIANLAYNKVS